MKNVFYIIILFQLISCEVAKDENVTKILVNVDLISKNDVAFKYEKLYWDSLKYKTYHIKLSIINKSKNPIAFWLMSCSWQENIMINNDYFAFNSWGCDSNVPIIYRLNPNDTLVRKAAIHKIENSRYQEIETTKFGLIYIDTVKIKEYGDYHRIMGDKSQYEKIFWSNPLYLNENK